MSTNYESVRVMAPNLDTERRILTPEAMDFIRELHTRFEPVREELLRARKVRQSQFDAGQLPDFLESTREIRNSDWRVAAIPANLQDRRVEITGPVERKMIINALNSGANVFMADFEDSNSPTWQNCIEGQSNLCDAVAGTIEYTSPEGRQYRIGAHPAVLFVRPRGWHLNERHFLVENRPVSAALFDFGLFFFHNAKAQLARGTAPYFYLPKLESHLEARLWNDVFLFAQEYLGIPAGTIRATVLIETITAAFEMDEILYELRDHSAGLNCGRWDYIFSFIKKFRNHPDRVLPERGLVTMTQPFLKNYVDLLIYTCHRRGIHAMGGMAAQIPIRNNPEVNEKAMESVRQDKLREVRAGHDGTWVAHPGLVPVAKQIFDEYMKTPNQIQAQARPAREIRAADLLEVPEGPITRMGFRRNLDVSLRYLESWLRGNGCVPIYNLMEDAATAEICRAQLWQWIHYHARLDDGTPITEELATSTLAEILTEIEDSIGETAFAETKFPAAADLLVALSRGEFEEFLTSAAYGQLD